VQRDRRGSREPVEEHVQGVNEVEVVLHELAGLRARKTVDEVERPESAEWVVEPQDDPPALAGHGLDPVTLLAVGRGRSEVVE
jgi:hypothetical protein